MKKIIILIVALVLLVSTAMAENFSNMTDGELMALDEQVSSEMANRNLLSEAPGDQDGELRRRRTMARQLMKGNEEIGRAHV